MHEGEMRAESAHELTHEQREALRADLTRIREFFEREFERDGSRGVAVFSAGLDNAWRTLPLGDPVADKIAVGREFYLSPLVPLVGRGDGALIAVVGRERGTVYTLRAGKLEEVVDQFDETPGRHDQGGWSQARYQRHIESLVHEHLKEVAEQLDRRVRRLQSPRIVVVTTEETRAELEEVLSHEVRNAIVGWTQAEAHATPAQLLQAARPILEEWHAKQEREAGERWREESGAAAGRRRVGPIPSRRPPTGESSCSSSRKARSTLPGSARAAGGSAPKEDPVRSTERRWSSATTVSIWPSTRRSRTAGASLRSALPGSRPGRGDRRPAQVLEKRRRPGHGKGLSPNGDCP
jgi:hypothetical protein